jgi:hypothetical protein
MNLLPTFYTQHLKTQLKRTEFLILSMLVVILQNHREVRLEQLANLFPQKILFESRRKKLQRFLSLPNLTIEKIWWPLFSHWLTNNFDLSEILYIAIDRTQWGLINLIFVSLIYQKRAIPIYFEILPKVGNTKVDKQIEVLSLVLPLLKNYKKVVLGDRKFCAVDLAQWLKGQPKTYFCLRLKRNEYIEVSPNIWVKLQDLGVNPGMSIYWQGVQGATSAPKRLQGIVLGT